MNITLIHYSVFPVIGGVEKVLADQAEMLKDAGHQVTIIVGNGKSWAPNIPVRVIPLIHSSHPLILRMRSKLDRGIIPNDFDTVTNQLFQEVSLALANTDFVIVHNISTMPMNLALTAALFQVSQQENAPRFILWHHDIAWSMPQYQRYLFERLPWNLLKTPWPRVIHVTISSSRKDEIVRVMHLDPDEIKVVPAGIRVEKILGLQKSTQALIEKLNLMDAEPMILTPVRITPRKNLELAFRVIYEVKKSMPKVMLVVTGPVDAHNPSSINYFKQLLRLRDKLGLSGSIHIVAENIPQGLENSEMADFYRLADILLLTSIDEGFGIPIIEAGISKMSIFCTDLPALRALAGNWATYFSVSATPTSIASKIYDRLQTDQIYQFRLHVKNNYSMKKIYHFYLEPMLKRK
jgi:glycosyltransferase involved in cell wall biosynthesis